MNEPHVNYHETGEWGQQFADLPHPKLKLVGTDGNAFAIMGKVRQALLKAKWPQDKVDLVMKEMRSGDYDHLLQTAMLVCDVR